MATRALVLITDVLPSGKTIYRQQLVEQWPLTVGRAFDNDIVLVDTYVAAHHLHIDCAADQLSITVLQSRNGAKIGNVQLSEGQNFSLAASDTLTIGRAQLSWIDESSIGNEDVLDANASTPVALNDDSFDRALPMAAKSSTSAEAAASRSSAFKTGAAKNSSSNTNQRINWQYVLGIFLLLFAVTSAEAFITNNPDTYVMAAVKAAGLMLAIVVVWSFIWALMTKVFSGKLRFIEHAVLTATFVVVTSVLLWHLDMLSFAFSIEWLGQIDVLVGIIALGWLIFKHLNIALQLNDGQNPSASRLRKTVGAAVMALVVGGAGLVLGLRYQATGRITDGLYMSTFMPPSWRLHKAQSPDVLINGMAAIKQKADAEATNPNDKSADLDSENDE